MEKEDSGKKMNIRDFIKEIALPEFKSVIGKGGGKIVFLVIILFISMIAMGIANGSLNYLSEKMNDPFVKFVDVYHKYEAKEDLKIFLYFLPKNIVKKIQIKFQKFLKHIHPLKDFLRINMMLQMEQLVYMMALC